MADTQQTEAPAPENGPQNPETASQVDGDQAPEKSPEDAANGVQEGDEGDKPDSDEETDKEEQTAEWKDAEIERLRKEAARYRTSLRSVEEKLEKAKSQEDFEKAVHEWTEERLALTRELVAEKHHLPADLAELLKGSTKEELEAHAKKLSKYATSGEPEGNLSGGLDPASPGASLTKTDPRELARAVPR